MPTARRRARAHFDLSRQCRPEPPRTTGSKCPSASGRRLVTAELQDANSQTPAGPPEHRRGEPEGLTTSPVTARLVFEIAGHFTGDPDREGQHHR